MNFYKSLLLALTICCLSFIFSCGEDDPTPPEETTYTLTIGGQSSANESDPGSAFMVNIDPANDTGADIDISYDVSGTATEGTDFRDLSGTTSISSGESSVTVQIPFTQDTEEEGDETIIISLSSSGLASNVTLGSPSSHTITITDDDSAGTGNCPNDNSTNMDNWECDETPGVSNSYSESVNGDTRTITTNGIPTHDFRNQIPMIVNELNSSTKIFLVDATPSKAASVSYITDGGSPQWKFGVAKNGVPLDPAPAQPFIFENTETGEFNFDWVFEPNWNMEAVGLDCAIAHVQPDGTYHYHGDPAIYADQLLDGLGAGTTTPTTPVQIGWAADGYPVLYKYGPDGAGGIALLEPSYQIKSGERPGDGVSEPCGEYNGKYTNDFEFVSGAGDLDECNGISRNIMIEGETYDYFYVVTEGFPVISRCLVGTPDQSFKIGM